MSAAELLDYVKNGGAYCAPLLLLALMWVNADRNRLVKTLEDKDVKLELLSERALTVMAELKTFLFNERR